MSTKIKVVLSIKETYAAEESYQCFRVVKSFRSDTRDTHDIDSEASRIKPSKIGLFTSCCGDTGHNFKLTFNTLYLMKKNRKPQKR